MSGEREGSAFTSYNGGKYDFRQQTFCLSMATCLSFILTGRSAEPITKRFRASVENVLQNEAAQEWIGKWKLVWGPVVYADAFVGAKTSVNSMFMAAPEGDPGQVVLAIAGTNGNSLMGWMIEDFNVKEKVPWPYADTDLRPHVSKGIAYGFAKLLDLAERDTKTGALVTARDFLAAHPSIRRIMVTGHSLGGALAPPYALYLENTRQEWDRARTAVISCLTTAGQTPGDADFSELYGERLSARTERVWNALDIAPHAYRDDMLLRIPGMYDPQIPPQRQVVKLIESLHREVAGNGYRHVLPEAAAFPSTYMRLEDIAGEKYKTFTDFIEGTLGLVKKAAPFGSKDLMGTLGFVGHGLLQHIFPYFSHFGVDEFIKIMSTAANRPPKRMVEKESICVRFRSIFRRRDRS